MKLKIPRHIIAVLSLLMLALNGQSVALGYVWCFGEDGNVALEYATGGDTCRTGSQSMPGACHSEPASGESAGERHAPACIDLDASEDTIITRARQEQGHAGQVPAPPVSATLPAITMELTGLRAPCPQLPTKNTQDILPLRTTILLI